METMMLVILILTLLNIICSGVNIVISLKNKIFD
jgi:hypothetical protein